MLSGEQRVLGVRVVQNGTGWWKKVLDLGGGNAGKWLRDNLSIKIGDGAEVKFWHHCWAGPTPLKSIFPRLFRISDNKEGSVRSMDVWVNGKWEWRWKWRRRLYGWENDAIEEMLSLINNINLSAGTKDGWSWKASKDGVFSTKSTYLTISSTRSENSEHNVDIKTIAALWNAPAPYKAITTAWRVLKNRIPTCGNLVKRNVLLTPSEKVCLVCFSQAESVKHIFLRCTKVIEVWTGILGWLGMQSGLHGEGGGRLEQFMNLGSRKVEKKLLLGIWVCTIWTIWKWRNECKFGNRSWDSAKVFSEIKARIWSWCRVYCIPVIPPNFSSWFVSAKSVFE